MTLNSTRVNQQIKSTDETVDTLSLELKATQQVKALAWS